MGKRVGWVLGSLAAIWLVFWVLGVGILVQSERFYVDKQPSVDERLCAYFIGVTIDRQVIRIGYQGADRCPLLASR